MVSEQMNEDIIFDSYIFGTMNDAEKKRFEESLASDPELKKRFDVHREIANSVRRKEMKAFLVSVDEKEKGGVIPAAASAHSPFRFVISIAAVVILLVGCGILFYVMKDSGMATRMSESCDEYIAKAEVPAVRGGECVDVQAVYNLISEGRCTEARELISNYRVTLSIDIKQRDDFTTSEEYEYYIETRKICADQLDWCEALLYLKLGDEEKVKGILESISKSDSFYSADAQKMLNDLWQ